MKASELIDHVAEAAGLEKAHAKKAVEAVSRPSGKSISMPGVRDEEKLGPAVIARLGSAMRRSRLCSERQWAEQAHRACAG